MDTKKVKTHPPPASEVLDVAQHGLRVLGPGVLEPAHEALLGQPVLGAVRHAEEKPVISKINYIKQLSKKKKISEIAKFLLSSKKISLRACELFAKPSIAFLFDPNLGPLFS